MNRYSVSGKANLWNLRTSAFSENSFCLRHSILFVLYWVKSFLLLQLFVACKNCYSDSLQFQILSSLFYQFCTLIILLKVCELLWLSLFKSVVLNAVLPGSNIYCYAKGNVSSFGVDLFHVKPQNYYHLF